MSWRHEEKWSPPGPRGFEAYDAGAHVLGKPGQFGLFYIEYVGSLPSSLEFLPYFLRPDERQRLVFREWEAGLFSKAVPIAEFTWLENGIAVGSSRNGDTVLAFFGSDQDGAGRWGPFGVFVTAMPAGKGRWTKPIRLAAHNGPLKGPTPGVLVNAADVSVESAEKISVAYNLWTEEELRRHVYVATWTKGKGATAQMLEGWPVGPPASEEPWLRVVPLPDGSLILVQLSKLTPDDPHWGVQVAHWWNGEVLATSQEQLPGEVLDMDIDSEGRLHVVGISQDAFWYQRGTPGWIGH